MMEGEAGREAFTGSIEQAAVGFTGDLEMQALFKLMREKGKEGQRPARTAGFTVVG